MPYHPQTWNNDDPDTPLSAARLTHMEEGIEAVDTHLEQTIDAHDASAISVTSNLNNVTGTVQSSLVAIDADKASVSMLAGRQSILEKGQANGYPILDAGAKIPTAELGTGTANNTTYLRGDRTWATVASGAGGSFQYDLVSDFGADPSGTDFSDTALAAATTAIRASQTLTLTSPSGITIFIPRGYYKFASPWDLSNIHGVTFIGEGHPTSIDHNAATVLAYTGNGPRGIDCRSSHGVTFTGIQVCFTSATFCGTLLDFSRYKRNIASATTSTASTTVTSVSAVAADVDRQLFGTGMPGGHRIQSVVPGVSWTLYLAPTVSGTTADAYVASDDTAYCWFKNGNLRGITTRGGSDGTGGTGALVANISRLIGFGGAIICGIDNVNLNRAGRAIEGTYAGDAAYNTYSNVITVRNCTFYYISQAAIFNPGQSWTIDKNTFEGFQDIAKDHMPALATDRNGDVRSSGGKFTSNWCGDAVPTYWLDLYSAYGWEISGNYFSRIGASTLPYMDDPWINLRLSGGISITGNEFYAETSPAVNPPIFYASSELYSGEIDEAVRGIIFTGNNVRSGNVPLNYLGLSDIAIFANDWPTTITAPGNGYYLTDSSAAVISSGGGGGGGGTDETVHALDYLNGDGVAETLANINALKTAANGKILIFDAPSVDYNFTNIGATGFVFTSPTIVRGPGCGNDQVTGGLSVGRLIFPDGVTAFTFSGNGSQGGASTSRLEDIYIKGPINPTLGTNDGVRVRAGSFVATNVQVVGFNRDCWNIDTDDTTNANCSSFRNCHAYNAKRHGFYTVGTNSNGITFMDCDANTSVTGYGFYTGGPPHQRRFRCKWWIH